MFFKDSQGNRYSWFNDLILDNLLNGNMDVDLTLSLITQPFDSSDSWNSKTFPVKVDQSRSENITDLFEANGYTIESFNYLHDNLKATVYLTMVGQLFLRFTLFNLKTKRGETMILSSAPYLIMNSVLDFNLSENLVVKTRNGYKEILFDWFAVVYRVRDIPYDHVFAIGRGLASFNDEGPLIIHSYEDTTYDTLFTPDEIKQFPHNQVDQTPDERNFSGDLIEYSISTITGLIYARTNQSFLYYGGRELLMLIFKNGQVRINSRSSKYDISLAEITQVLACEIEPGTTGRPTYGYIVFADANHDYKILTFRGQDEKIVSLNWPHGLSTSLPSLVM